MPQAKILTGKEIRRVLDYVGTRPHAARNRAIIMCTHLAGMRVGECAELRLSDVLDGDGQVRSEIRLGAEQTKGSRGRVVFVGERLQRELAAYMKQLPTAKGDGPLFRSQKRGGFSTNTLCQTLNRIYANAGLEGATSHSGRRTFITALASKGARSV